MSSLPLILYHGTRDCPDGYGAAFACWHKYKSAGAEYLPMDHVRKDITLTEFHTLVPQIAGRLVYILDFSFPKHIMQHIFALAAETIWIDHHKESFEMWLGRYTPGMKYTKSKFDNVTILLDDNRSAAWLTWLHFNPSRNAIPPTLFMLIDDRDRWQWKMKGTREAHCALMSMRPWTFYKWSVISIPDLLDTGARIAAAEDAQIASLLQAVQPIHIPMDDTIPGMFEELRKGLACNTALHVDEVGHRMYERSKTFGCCWRVSKGGVVSVSLRSAPAGADVSQIARRYGGGGHRNAAGFTTDLMTIARWLK